MAWTHWIDCGLHCRLDRISGHSANNDLIMTERLPVLEKISKCLLYPSISLSPELPDFQKLSIACNRSQVVYPFREDFTITRAIPKSAKKSLGFTKLRSQNSEIRFPVIHDAI